jgi:hypothetical protein
MRFFHKLTSIIMIVTALAFVACDDGGGSGGGSGAGDAVVDIAAIPGVTPPAYNEIPVTSITETDQYTGIVSWDPEDDPFEAETVYTVTITLTAKSGYTLAGVEEDFFDVAGADSVTNDADSGVVTAVFPATGSVPATVITIASIPGVTVPVVGATPVTTITETDQYTGTVSWNPTDATFAATTVYTATITLTAKSGYTLTGVTADFFTVAGATATNSADSGVVTAIFPQADWATYNLRDTGPAGGLIFYINPNAATDGWKYLEAAPADADSTLRWLSVNEWLNGSTAAEGETQTGIGTGAYNMK